MPRKCKRRSIKGEFNYKYFKPRAVPICELKEVKLTPCEMEAMRLGDIEEMYQADAAEKMEVSRQTFGNIIQSAHKKIADALINGKAIKIIDGEEE